MSVADASEVDAARAVDLARANLYRYLAAAVAPPGSERFRRLFDGGLRSVVEAAVDWIRSDPAYWPAALGPGELAPSQAPTAALFPRERGAAEAYLRTFGHSIGKDCPAYELEYCPNRDITYRAHRLADLTGFYRAFGLDRAADSRDRMDHLGYQAEFMQIVLARRLYAQAKGLGEEPAERCREAERVFFREHLGWWLAGFGTRLEQRAASPFYRSLGRLLRAFSAAERAVLGLPPFAELPDVCTDEQEPAGTGFSCGSCPPPPGAGRRASS